MILSSYGDEKYEPIYFIMKQIRNMTICINEVRSKKVQQHFKEGLYSRFHSVYEANLFLT